MFQMEFFLVLDGDCEPVIFCLFGWKRQRPPEVFCEKSDSKKKRLQRRCFPVNFVKFLRMPFLQNASGRLLQKRLLLFFPA